MNMTSDDIAIMVSVIYFGNMFSPIPSGMMMDSVGRKTTLHILSVIPILSWILVYIAKTPMVLHFSRVLAGIWIGVVSTVVPMYVGEISEPEVRGALSTVFQIMMMGGVWFVFFVGSLVDYYSLTYILSALPILLACVLFYIPESPYWYVKQGRHNDAVKSLCWLRSTSQELLKNEITQIDNTVIQDLRNGRSYSDLFGSRGNLRALLMVEVLSCTQRASGISALLAYTSITLPAGVGVLSVNDCVTLIGATLSLTVIFSTFLVDKSGRKPLLVFSSLGAGLFMFLSGLWFYLDSNTGKQPNSP